MALLGVIAPLPWLRLPLAFRQTIHQASGQSEVELRSRLTKMTLTPAQTALLRDRILAFARQRAYPKTFCPSEIARALTETELETLDAQHWREAMDKVRKVIWELRASGRVEVLQRGEPVDLAKLDDIRGPIRVRSTLRL